MADVVARVRPCEERTGVRISSRSDEARARDSVELWVIIMRAQQAANKMTSLKLYVSICLNVNSDSAKWKSAISRVVTP